MKKNIKLATAGFCGPCKGLKTQLEHLGIDVPYITFEDDLDQIKKYNIRTVPTLVVEDGDDVSLVRGVDEILKTIQENI